MNLDKRQPKSQTRDITHPVLIQFFKIYTILVAWLGSLTGQLIAADATEPNIVFVLFDDMGSG